jgi:hypothetical protein
MNPEFPIFIPTKGRWVTPHTIRVMQSLGIPFKAVVEEPEYRNYARVVDRADILVLPHRDKGLTVTRNWIWEYAKQELKTPYFWTFDDNITLFYRMHQNVQYRLTSGTFLKVIEDFAKRYTNLYITGMTYHMFAPRRNKNPPFILNTRVYSNMLIKTDIPYRNRLFYNDDTDLCLQILKGGHCTCQFVAFLAKKMATMRAKGGMTIHYEKTNKRLEFAQELQRAHPDVVKIVWRYNRWHHQVDYRPFAGNKLIRRKGIEIPQGVNDYGMRLLRSDGERLQVDRS